MASNIARLPVISPEPRRSVRDQDEETQAAYLTRIGQPASRKTTALALAHYEGELAEDRAVTKIYDAGYDAGYAAGRASVTAQPHLRLADVTAASSAAIRQASR